MIVATEMTNTSEIKFGLMHPAGIVQVQDHPEVLQNQIVPIVINQDQINREVIVPMHQEQILIVQDQIVPIVTN
jgi:hypothetical protein